MKSKMNLTIDEKLIPQSKEYARMHGMSVSQLVEELLRSTVQQNTPTFSDRWRGKFVVADKDDERYAKLKDRFLDDSSS